MSVTETESAVIQGTGCQQCPLNPWCSRPYWVPLDHLSCLLCALSMFHAMARCEGENSSVCKAPACPELIHPPILDSVWCRLPACRDQSGHKRATEAWLITIHCVVPSLVNTSGKNYPSVWQVQECVHVRTHMYAYKYVHICRCILCACWSICTGMRM